MTSSEKNSEQINPAFAEIIIPLALPVNYTWAIPSQFANVVKPGVRAEVQLKNKRYSGIVKKNT